MSTQDKHSDIDIGDNNEEVAIGNNINQFSSKDNSLHITINGDLDSFAVDSNEKKIFFNKKPEVVTLSILTVFVIFYIWILVVTLLSDDPLNQSKISDFLSIVGISGITALVGVILGSRIARRSKG